MNTAYRVVFLFALFALNAAAQEDKGTLCFVSPKDKPLCTAASGLSPATKSAPGERTFVWSSADAKRIAFGIVPAEAGTADLSEKALTNIALTIRGDQRHGWPAELRLRIDDAKQKERSWTWTVPAKAADALTQLMLPPGRYVITIAADHHLTFRRQLELAKNVALREVTLRPMPVVSGRVVGPNEKAVADAQILRDDNKVVATTDEQGNFRGEALEPLPKSLIVGHSGFGSRIVAPQFATGDADLGVIRLSTALKLALRIVRPDGSRDPLRVKLARRPDSQYEYLVVGSKELKADADAIDFADLGKGEYSVIVEGAGTFEKLATAVTIGEANVEKEIRIEPYRLDGTASLGDDPLNGSLSVSMGGVPMQFVLPVANGRFSGTLWQHGKVYGWMRTEVLGASEPVTSPELGADPSPWNIVFPKRFITGRVFDADTQQAIAGAAMELQRHAGQSRFYSSVRLGDDGSFSILATKSGTYEMKVSAPAHVQAKQSVELRDEDGSVRRDFALTEGIPTVLEVTWASGRPVANAHVTEGVSSDGHNAERHYSLDAMGRLTLRLQRGESKTLYVIPAEGSFAIAHVAAQEGSESAPIRLIVPDPAGSLKIEVTDADGKKAPTGVGMRFNGEPVPTPVLYQIGFRATPGSLTDQTLLLMPAGAYELWPVSMKTFTASGPMKSVTLAAGETTVSLTTSR